jgi:hypothetical protein
MERLSVNPYSIRLLHLSIDAVPFLIDEMVVYEVANTSIQSLFESGNLFSSMWFIVISQPYRGLTDMQQLVTHISIFTLREKNFFLWLFAQTWELI